LRAAGLGGRGRVLVLAPAHDRHLENGDRPGAQEVHGRDDHLGEPRRRDLIAFDVEEEVPALDVAAVGEVNAEVALHPVGGALIDPMRRRGRIGREGLRQVRRQRSSPQKRWMRRQASSKSVFEVA
jgi:hypothetical protein